MMEEEAADDSRTSVVGRKRDRQGVSQYREPLASDDSSDGDSHGASTKRVKQTHASADAPTLGDGLVASTASSLPVDRTDNGGTLEADRREEVDLPALSGRPDSCQSPRDPDANMEIPGAHLKPNETTEEPSRMSSDNLPGVAMTSDPTYAMEGVEPALASGGEEYSPDPAAEIQTASSTAPANSQGATASGWNKGVQSGLRTSFGKRPISVAANIRTEDLAASTSSSMPVSGDDDIRRDNTTKQISGDTSSSSPGTDDRESSMFTFGAGPSSQAHEPHPKKGGFKPLSKAARRELQPDEREAYNKALAANETEQKEEGLVHKTAQADQAIAREGKWPLHRKYGDILRWIRNGKTFYPRLDRKPKAKPFEIHFVIFDTPCGLDDNGIPIKCQDFSFNTFAKAFLESNAGKLRDLRDGDLQLAFQQYCNHWYAHLGSHLQSLLATATASDALTLQQAMQDPGLPSMSSNSQLVASPEGLAQPPGKLSNQVGKEQEHESNTSHALDEIKSQTGGAMTTDHTNHIDSVNQRTTYSSQADSAAVKIHDSDTSRLDGVALKTESHSVEAIELTGHELELEIELQQKYFPVASTRALPRCLACGDAGHRARECPALFCTLCSEKGKHSNFTCPSKQTCGKCRQRGHQTLDCPEKLFATTAEAKGCDICGSIIHTEGACHFIWRSFAPQTEEIRTVSNIPVYCYTCGASGHYGPECGLHTRPLLSGGYTWSKSNLMKYLDPVSQERALSAGVDYSIPRPKEFNIKGKGRVNDPFTIEDSDDENDFIRPKIDRPGPHANIRFAERPRREKPVLSHAPTGPHIRPSYQNDNLSYNVAMDSIPPDHYRPLNGYSPNIPAPTGPREPSGHFQFQFSGNQRGPGGGESNDNGGGKKRKKRNQNGQASNNPNAPPPTKPKKKSSAKRREKAAKNAR